MIVNSKTWLLMGTLSGFFGVVIGAFGAHGLKEVLNQRSMEIYQTAVQYQMIHSLALIALGLWSAQNAVMNTQVAGLGFVLGIVLFSGTLYALALTRIHFLGIIAPLGGISFLVGWIAFAFLAWRS